MNSMSEAEFTSRMYHYLSTLRWAQLPEWKEVAGIQYRFTDGIAWAIIDGVSGGKIEVPFNFHDWIKWLTGG